MSIPQHLSSAASFVKWCHRNEYLAGTSRGECYEFVDVICKARERAVAMVRFHIDGPVDRITSEDRYKFFSEDAKLLRHLPAVHWNLHCHGVVTCGLCGEEVDDICLTCRRARKDLCEITARAVYVKARSGIFEDVLGHIIGLLATIAAGTLMKMPTLTAR
jgi:hypothetical protein